MAKDDLWNEEAEENILGIMMVDNDKIQQIISILNEDDIYDRANKLIFKAIKAMAREDKPVDIVTVSEYLRFNNELDIVGGRAYVDSLAEAVITTVNWKNYCKIIIKYSKKRQLLTLADTIVKETSSEDVEDIAIKAKKEIEDILINRTSNNISHIFNGLDTVITQVENILTSDSKLLGVSTGIHSLDYMLSGLVAGRLYILGARPSQGKGYSLDTLTLTPTGWVKNRDIKLGDTVIGRDGKPTKVIGVYPQPLQDCYKITLKDGREVICDAPHEWTVYSSKWGRERTLTAEELYQKLQYVRYQGRISLPRFTGDYGIEKDFIIPPYIMGVLIGDGCLTMGGLSYCKPSQYVLEEVRKHLPDGVKANFRRDNKHVGITGWKSAKEYIRQVGLDTQSYNKFIPREYFHSSKAQREKLLKGLLDTDGYNTGKGYEYSTTSEQLAKDVQQLAWSLGYCAKISTRVGKYKKDNQVTTTRLNYRVFITSTKPLTIMKMEKVEPIPTQCIHVDNEDSLFVIEDYIVTHNSALAQQIAETVASNKDKNVVFASLEMGLDEYTQRSLFRKINITQEMLSRGLVNESIYDKIAKQSEYLSTLNLYILDNPDCTLSDLEAGIMNCINSKGTCDLVVVDYLQLMASDDRKERDPLKVVSRNSSGLKKLARKYNVPVLALCQLSRSLESRMDKRPILSDLRESGTIEQDADVVMFIYRDEVYNKDDPASKGMAELLVSKNRQGRTGIIDLVFEANKTLFKEIKVK